MPNFWINGRNWNGCWYIISVIYIKMVGTYLGSHRCIFLLQGYTWEGGLHCSSQEIAIMWSHKVWLRSVHSRCDGPGSWAEDLCTFFESHEEGEGNPIFSLLIRWQGTRKASLVIETRLVRIHMYASDRSVFLTRTGPREELAVIICLMTLYMIYPNCIKISRA